MNKFYKTILTAIVSISALGCSPKEAPVVESTIDVTVSYDDKTFGAPEGKLLLFDITEAELKSHYLIDAGGMFALTRKDGKHEFPYRTAKLGRFDSEVISNNGFYLSYIDDEYSYLPAKMLLYVYIEKPTSKHRNMYSFIEVNVGEKDFKFEKSFPAIIYVKNPESIYDAATEYVKW